MKTFGIDVPIIDQLFLLHLGDDSHVMHWNDLDEKEWLK